jgi:hypothetical protein
VGTGWRAVLLVLIVVLLAHGGGYAQDEPVELKADTLRYGPRIIYAKGHVSLKSGAAAMEADEMRMDQERGFIYAWGNVKFTLGGNTIHCESLSYSTRSGTFTMWKAAGVGKDIKVSDQPVQQDIRFWAERAEGTTSRMVLRESVLTTCDYPPPTYHYHFRSKEVIIYPEDKLIAKHTGLYLKNHLLYRQGVIVLPLKRDERRIDQNLIPKVGYNSIDGWYAKEAIGYLAGQRDWGTLHIDWFEKTGIGKGIEHNYHIKGDTLTGRVYYYRLDSRVQGASRYELSNTSTFKLPGNLSLTWNYNENQYQYPGYVSPPNRSTSFSVGKSGKKHSFNFSNSQSISGDNLSSTYNLLYNYRLSHNLSANFSADLAKSSSVFSSTERLHYIGKIMNTGKLFDTQLDVEQSSGATNYFVNREPEVTIRSHGLSLAGLPLDVTLSTGLFHEMPSDTRVGRGDFRFILADTPHQVWRNGTLTVGGGLRQLAYTTRDARYAWMARGAFVQSWGNFINLRLDYNYQQPYGHSPLQFDFLNVFETMGGGIEFRGRDVWSLSLSSAYDFRNRNYQSLISRLAVQPKKGTLLSFSATSDMNSGSWLSLDSQMRVKISPQLSVNFWGYYDIPNRRFTYQDYIVTREEHDWATSLIYRSAQQEMWLTFSLKAFPSMPLSVGANPDGVIIPQGMFNQFGH